MADLGLAIAGVTATGVSLTQWLLALYKSTRNAQKEAKDIADRVQLITSVLKGLNKTLRKSVNLVSRQLENDVQAILSRCKDIFERIKKGTGRINTVSEEGIAGTAARLGSRVVWHFKKPGLRLLEQQLDSIQITLNLMVSTITLGRKIRKDRNEKVSEKVEKSLSDIKDRVQGGKSTLALLSTTEDEYFQSTSNDDQDHPTDSPSLRIYDDLAAMTGFNDIDSSCSQSRHSEKSEGTLSQAQREIVGSASDDIEGLLERWTNLSESISTKDGNKENGIAHLPGTASDDSESLESFQSTSDEDDYDECEDEDFADNSEDDSRGLAISEDYTDSKGKGRFYSFDLHAAEGSTAPRIAKTGADNSKKVSEDDALDSVDKRRVRFEVDEKGRIIDKGNNRHPETKHTSNPQVMAETSEYGHCQIPNPRVKRKLSKKTTSTVFRESRRNISSQKTAASQASDPNGPSSNGDARVDNSADSAEENEAEHSSNHEGKHWNEKSRHSVN
jgi:hypothetical protein